MYTPSDTSFRLLVPATERELIAEENSLCDLRTSAYRTYTLRTERRFQGRLETYHRILKAYYANVTSLQEAAENSIHNVEQLEEKLCKLEKTLLQERHRLKTENSESAQTITENDKLNNSSAFLKPSRAVSHAINLQSPSISFTRPTFSKPTRATSYATSLSTHSALPETASVQSLVRAFNLFVGEKQRLTLRAQVLGDVIQECTQGKNKRG